MDDKRNFFRVLGLVVLILIFVMLLFNPVALIKMLGNIWDVDVNEELALNKWLLRALSLASGYATFYIYTHIFSFSRKRRQQGITAFVVGGILFYLLMFLFTRDYVFNPKGEPVQCCAPDLQGHYEKVPCKWKVHPKYGTKVRPCTPEMIRNMNGIEPREIKPVRVREGIQFFSPDGQPLYWYYKRDDGRYEIFDFSGYHPRYGVKLKPVTIGVAREILSYVERGETSKIIYVSDNKQITPVQQTKKVGQPDTLARKHTPLTENNNQTWPPEKIINTQQINSPDYEEVAIYITGNNGYFRSDFSRRIAKVFSNKYKPVLNFFHFNHTPDGNIYFDRLQNGDTQVYKALNLKKYVDYVSLASINVHTSRSGIDKDMTKAELHYDIGLYRSDNGQEVKHLENTVYGTGWSAEQAVQNSMNKAFQQIKFN